MTLARSSQSRGRIQISSHPGICLAISASQPRNYTAREREVRTRRAAARTDGNDHDNAFDEIRTGERDASQHGDGGPNERSDIDGEQNKCSDTDGEQYERNNTKGQQSHRIDIYEPNHPHRDHHQTELLPINKITRKGYAPCDIRRKSGPGKQDSCVGDAKKDVSGDRKVKVPKF